MSIEDYDKALKLGQKEYHSKVLKGDYPYLPVLDDILSNTDIETRTDLGLVDIPLDLIVGTSTQGRTTAFSGNFMPLLKTNTEFAHKWIHLSDQLLEEGQRDPIIAYEFMNKYYVVEGNKRVSVSKFFNNVSLYGHVTRIVPKKTDDPDVIIYYEYIDFYNMTKINYIWFSKEGSFPKLLNIASKNPGEIWTQDERSFFRSCYLAFSKEYKKSGGDKLKITVADAMLAYMTIYGYKDIPETSVVDMKKNLTKIWAEFLMLEEQESVALVMEPAEEPKKNLLTKLISPPPAKLRAAFLHSKTAKTSAWTYAHELGRLHVDQVFEDKLETCRIDNLDPANEEECIQIINQAIEDNDIIFTTTIELRSASVKAAIEHPGKKILNCSVNTSHRYIRTYYGRMHEAKFLTGAIAGALCENGKIGYIADYPIYGMIANINAFALGAKMVNPRAKIYLEWSTVKDRNIQQYFKEQGVSYISNKDMIAPRNLSREFGLYCLDENDSPVNLAMPVWHWGVMYEKIVQSIISGSWKNEDAASKQALNYWWGIPSGVIDVICSQRLPIGTKRLVELLKKNIGTGNLNPFSGILYAQDGIIQEDENASMSPEDILTMNWLAENIIGSIPTLDELKDEAKPIVLIQGLIEKDKK